MRRTPLVGRESELTRLMPQAITALRGQGRVLALVGDAGIGKTCLSEALVQNLLQSLDTSSGCTLYAGDCQPYAQHTPYAALRAPLLRLFGLYRDDMPDPDRLSTLCKTHVTQFAPQLTRFIPLLSDVLGGELPETPLTRWLTIGQRHDRLQQLLVALLLGAATQKPLVLRLDDLHWADASSLELLNRLAQEAQHTPLLLLLSYRPDPPIAEPWAEWPTTSRLVLSGLSAQECKTLLTTLLNDTPPVELLPLLERTQGNPLFIEELVRALIDTGALTRDPQGMWQLTRALDHLTIPHSIEELFVSRLERLDAQQHELVQVSSVIGQRFEHPIIESAYSQPAMLDQQIGALIAANIMIAEQPDQDNPAAPTDAAAASTYLFRHSLLRDVAYAGILHTRRRELHRRVAQSIEDLHAHHLDQYAAQLAQHYLLAEDWLPAFAYHLAAGIQAQQRYANRDALELFKTAIKIFPHIHPHAEAELSGSSVPDQTQRFMHLIEAHERCGDIALLLGAYDAAQAAYLEALRCIRALPKRSTPVAVEDSAGVELAPAIVRLHHHIASVQERRADYEGAFTWLGHGIQQASRHTQLELGHCFLLAAGIYQRQGQYDQALDWTQRALQVIEQHGSRNDLAHAYYSLGGTYGKLGRTREALAATEQSLRLYEELENIAGQADAHNNLANVLSVAAGRWQESARHYQIALELKAAVGDAHGQAILANNLGDLKRKLGAYDQALHYFSLALDQFTELGSDYGVAVLHMNMGAVSVNQGALHAARQHLERSRQLFDRLGSEEFLAELYRIYAELELAEHQPHAALRWADDALALARRLHAHAEEAEARRVRGTILRTLARREEAITDLRQASVIFATIDNQPAVARCLEDLARTTDDQPEAAAALAEVQRIRREMLET